MIDSLNHLPRPDAGADTLAEATVDVFAERELLDLSGGRLPRTGVRKSTKAGSIVPPQRARYLETLFSVREKSGGWNDRVFPRSESFGTSMALLSLLEPGRRLDAGSLMLAASQGLAEVQVARRPVVAIVATGDELREDVPDAGDERI